jgi:hypothetical protein
MGQTDPQFNLRAEVAIFTNENIEFRKAHEGDIITSRREIGGVGTLEAQKYLWILVDGLEENDLYALHQTLFDGDPAGDDPVNEIEKRRFRIALADLALRDPDFDVERARDPLDIYQPYLQLDSDDFIFIPSSVLPFDAQGLVWDKSTGLYL